MSNGVRVNTDGTVEKFTTDKMLSEYLGYWITIVYTPNKKLVAIVDDEGILKGSKPNRIGTLYSNYHHTLVGDILFMKEDWTEDGPDLVEMSEEELNHLYDELMNFSKTHMI